MIDGFLRKMITRFGETEAKENPLEQFVLWFRDAAAESPGDWFDAGVMTLATSGAGGQVSARTVLLMRFDEEGFTFYSNYGSQKARQLSNNPRAALLFQWPHVQRQVRVEGKVEKVSRAESSLYFRSRPRLSQLGAAVSPQSEIIPSRDFVEEKARQLQDALGNQPVPVPETWGGYRLRPELIEFLDHRENRLHDRVRYLRQEGAWRVERLAP